MQKSFSGLLKVFAVTQCWITAFHELESDIAVYVANRKPIERVLRLAKVLCGEQCICELQLNKNDLPRKNIHKFEWFCFKITIKLD